MDNVVGNRGGVAYVTATLVKAGSSDENAVYSLPNHTFRSLGPAGLVVVQILLEASDVLGVTVLVNDLSLTATTNIGELIEDVTIGEHLLSFNKQANTIKFFV